MGSLGTVKLLAVAAGGLGLVAAAPVSADVVGLWNFNEFTSEQTKDYVNVTQSPYSPYANTATSPLAVSTGLENTRIASLAAIKTRDKTAVVLDSPALLMGANGVKTAPTPLLADNSYLGFSVSANVPITFETLTFELGVAAGPDTNSGDIASVDNYFQLFYSTDGGTTFVAVGPQIDTIADNTGNEGVFTGMLTHTVDLSSVSLNSGETAEFRMAFADNRGGGTTSMGHYLDNVSISAVPEPGSLGVLGLAALGLVRRSRRRA